jgi:aminoglycoside phosphotransferase (APT) family kinase protein
MTPPTPLPTSAAQSLADLDPALAGLPAAVEHAARQGWALDDARWAAGQSCLLAYRIPQAEEAAETFVAVHVDSTGWRCHDYLADPALPGLPAIADPTRAGRRMSSLLNTHNLRCQARPVRYRPGSRCVLRYDIDGPAGASTWYAKLFRADRAGVLAARHSQVRSAPGAADLVADVSAVWSDVGAVVARAVDGRPLSGALGDAAVPAEQRLNLASALGGMLAGFHQLSGVQGPHRSAADHVRSLEAMTPALRCADRSLAHDFSAILDALAKDVPTREPMVLTHGGFRPGQAALADDGTLTLLDLDGACWGAAARDLATAMAHLSWQALTHPDSRHVLEAARDCLVDGYQRRAGQLDPGALAWWRAAALLQVAARRYRRLEVSDWDRVPVLLEAAEQLLTPTASRRRPAPPQRSLPDLLDLDWVSAQLRSSVQRSGEGADRPVVAVSAETLATAPGRRTVVQYAVRGLRGDHIELLIGKHFTDAAYATLLYQLLADLSTALPAQAVPQPVAALAQGHLVVYRAAPGLPLDSLDGQATTAVGVRAAARWLARLHQSPVRLFRHLDVRREAVTAQQWATSVAECRPDLLSSVTELASGWVPAAAASVTGGRTVALHKDFHAGHVLVHDGGVCVVDLDEARHGPAGFDLAHFCTYLAAAGDSRCTHQDDFLREYAEAAGQPETGIDRRDESFAAWSAYTWLKIAKQRTLGSGPWRGVAGDRRQAVDDAIAQGLACLTR